MPNNLPLLLLVLLLAPWIIGHATHPYYAVFLLAGLLIALLLLLLTHPVKKAAVLLLGLVSGFFVPETLFFSPWFLYAALSEDFIDPAAIYALVVLLLSLNRNPLPNTYLLLCLLMLAAVLRITQTRIQAAQAKTHALYNEMQEAKLALASALQTTRAAKDREVELARLNERSRFTRDLHDGLGHVLSRAILQIGALSATASAPERDSLETIGQSLQEAMQDLRAHLHRLREDDFNLQQAVEEMIEKFTFADISLTYTLQTPLHLDAAYSLEAIIREALNNSLKHSDATHVSVKCLETKDRLFLTIKDNGTAPKIASLGIGMRSIRERAESLHGVAEFSTDDGFIVFVMIPKEAVHAHHSD